MKIPQVYLDLLLSEREPGEVYRLCLEEVQRSGGAPELTQDIVYGCEVRYAIEVLENGQPQRLYNFGDLDGRGTPLLWRVADPLERRRVAFVGAGPYPITALLLRGRHPDSRITCFDNQLVAFLLGRAVCQRLDPEIDYRLEEAHEVDYSEFDLVVVAAMVNEREKLTEKLLATTEAELLVRGDVSLRHRRLHTLASTFDEEGQLRF